MRIFEIDTSEDGVAVSRYIHWRAFEKLIDEGVMQLFTPSKYEDSDFFEGKLTEPYRRVLRRAHELQSRAYGDRDQDDYEQDLILTFDYFESVRRHCYISCWTLREQEDLEMWRSFASPGVLVRTTAGLVFDQLVEMADRSERYFGDNKEYGVYRGQIRYDREAMHFRLGLENYQNPMTPIFHLSGLEGENFSHEMEYRFAVVDYAGITVETEQVTSAPGAMEDAVKVLDVPFSVDAIQEVVYPRSLETQVRLLAERRFGFARKLIRSKVF